MLGGSGGDAEHVYIYIYVYSIVVCIVKSCNCIVMLTLVSHFPSSLPEPTSVSSSQSRQMKKLEAIQFCHVDLLHTPKWYLSNRLIAPPHGAKMGKKQPFASGSSWPSFVSF